MALDNVALILSEVTRDLLRLLLTRLGQRPTSASGIATLGRHLDSVQAFVDRIHLPLVDDRYGCRLNAAIHLLDHPQRLHERCDEEPERAAQLADAPPLASEAETTQAVVGQILERLERGQPSDACDRALNRSTQLTGDALALRARIMADVAAGELDVPSGTQRLEGLRWLRRVSYHAARVCDQGRDLWSPTIAGN